MKLFRKYKSPIGELTLATDGEALTEMLLQREAEELEQRLSGWKECNGTQEVLDLAEEWLDRYFAGEIMDTPTLKEDIEDSNGREYRHSASSGYTYTAGIGNRAFQLRPEGSPFRQEVWRLLCEIPYGRTVTYGNIAKSIAESEGIGKMSAQAVGGAVGHNPISVIIPCHRVIGANNRLVGFGGGIPAKVQLLKREGIDISELK